LCHEAQIQICLVASKSVHGTGIIDVEYIYGFVWWGVCKQSRWRHSV